MESSPQTATSNSLAHIDAATTLVLLDVDGTLAPIVENPADAAVDERTLGILASLKDQAAGVAIITGRTLDRAREMVPIDGIWVAAAHGMHMASPDGEEDLCLVATAARAHIQAAAQLAQTVGWHYEDKQHSVTVHFRQRGNLGQSIEPQHVRAQMMMVLDPTQVDMHDAKQAIEVRAIGSRTKAHGVQTIVQGTENVETVIYAGDDTTDVDAFRALDELAADGSVRVVKIAVGGAEAISELVELADIVVESQSEIAPLLESLSSQ